MDWLLEVAEVADVPCTFAYRDTAASRRTAAPGASPTTLRRCRPADIEGLLAVRVGADGTYAIPQPVSLRAERPRA